jgi:hypothetical protein
LLAWQPDRQTKGENCCHKIKRSVFVAAHFGSFGCAKARAWPAEDEEKNGEHKRNRHKINSGTATKY